LAEATGRKSTPYSVREIITKAVCGYAEKTFQYTRLVRLPPGVNVSKILGTTITNVSLPDVREASLSAQADLYVPVSGKFDIHVWYADEDNADTGIVKESIRVSEMLPAMLTSIPAGDEATARMYLTGSPKCVSAEVQDASTIKCVLEFSIRTEVIADTKLSVQVVSD